MSIDPKHGCCELWRRFRLELRCINGKKAVLMALLFLLIGIFDAIFCGNFYMYEMLLLPKSAPGRWLFILVWTVLYVMLGLSFYTILANKQKYCAKERGKGILLFVCMMIFNFIWCPLFFGAGAFFSAFLNILIMILLAFGAAICFLKISVAAFFVQLLLEIWLLYCAFLNLGIILIN